jgi:HTH-type transcriptional regulator, competence development regulator
MDSEYSTFGKNLKAIREAAGISQLDLAMKVERTQKTVSKIEQGKQRIFLADVYKFAEALQVPVGLLLVGQPNEDKFQDDIDELIVAESHTLPTAESRQALLTIVRTFCASMRSVSPK